MVRIFCDCGALYEVVTLHAPLGDTGAAVCDVCKRVMDRWSNARVYESYRLVRRPAAEPRIDV